MDSSGKWHLWLWVVSEEDEELRGRGGKKRGVERKSKREKSERTGVAGKRLGQALLLIY